MLLSDYIYQARRKMQKRIQWRVKDVSLNSTVSKYHGLYYSGNHTPCFEKRPIFSFIILVNKTAKYQGSSFRGKWSLQIHLLTCQVD